MEDLIRTGVTRNNTSRSVSLASISLQNIHEQNRAAAAQRPNAIVAPPATGIAARGKPRLLLMGQKR